MKDVLARLRAALGEAQLVLVGGAVRDELLGRAHADWDLATDLLPEAVMERARKAGLACIPTGLQHGTVTVLAEGVPFEITTFRSDGAYSDGRRPDGVRLGVTLEEDLSRRDFTLNAMALPIDADGGLPGREALVDPFGGQADLAAGLIRAVGDPLARFGEDGLRPLRACRFAAQLGFALDPATEAAIPQRLGIAAKVAVERAQVELTKLLCGPFAARGLDLLAATGLLGLWLPELRAMIGCGQNRHHRYDVWRHTLRAFEAQPPATPGLRWALLLHDAGKPGTRTVDEEGTAHFYGHEALSEELADLLLIRLKASHALRSEVKAQVRHHGVHPDARWTDAACRRFLRKLEEDHLSLDDWSAFRRADQIAKGWGDEPGGDPDYFAQVGQGVAATQARLQALLDAKPPLSPRALALDGRALMALVGRPGGPWLGELQKRLLEAVIEDPGLNTADSLGALAKDRMDRMKRKTE